jgi:serine phosphatase RsbU (regulator of sigma subunit)
VDLRGLLDAVEESPPVEAVEVLAAELARMVGAEGVSFLIADFSGDTLMRVVSPRVGGQRLSGDGPVPLTGSPHGRVIRSQQVRLESDGGWTWMYAPVTERGDALGVLELALPDAPDDETVDFVASAAHALAYVVIAGHRRTDLFERAVRRIPLSLEAEIQHRLLPGSYALEGGAFTIAGWLEPTNDIAGDSFDYSVERGALHLLLSDAIGHGLPAAQLATLAVSSLRNHRRGQADLVEQARAASAAVANHADETEEYVAALLARLDFRTGELDLVNAGHTLPYVIADGKPRTVELAADFPLGMFDDAEYRQQSLTLHPGDRLVLVTDGMLERNAASLDLPEALVATLDLHPREVVHRLTRTVLEQAGGDLEDDATLVCVDWYGPLSGEDDRSASAGASRRRASGATE